MKKTILRAVSLSVLVALSATSAAADEPVSIPVGATITVPLIVNVTEGVDASKLDEAIKKVNEIYKAAGVELAIVKKVQPYTPAAGNKDPNLTDAEGNEAQKQGQKEIDDFLGKIPGFAGKGVKLTLAKDVWVEKPSTAGWARHRNPVVFGEGASDVNSLARTIAHEFGHAFTLNYDLKDANFPDLKKRLMWGYTNGGTGLTPTEVNEIRFGAAKRGILTYPDSWFEKYYLTGTRKKQHRVANAAQFNGYSNLIVMGGSMDPNDPAYAFADIVSAGLYCFGPDQGILVNIQAAGLMPPDSFFDVTYGIELHTDSNDVSDIRGGVHITGSGGSYAGEVIIFEPVGLLPLPVDIEINKLFKEIGGTDADHSFSFVIPREYMAGFCDPYYGSFMVRVTSNAMMDGPLGMVNLADMSGEWFEYSNPLVYMPNEVYLGSRQIGPETVYTIAACGFHVPATVYINDIPAGIGMPDAKGCITFEVDPAMITGPGIQKVSVVDEMIQGWALGHFSTVEPVAGDLDNDTDVDFADFAVLAANWLVGVN